MCLQIDSSNRLVLKRTAGGQSHTWQAEHGKILAIKGWHHVTVTVDVLNKRATFYLWGREVFRTSIPDDKLVGQYGTEYTVQLGKRGKHGGYFYGFMEDFYFFSDAATANEAFWIMNQIELGKYHLFNIYL